MRVAEHEGVLAVLPASTLIILEGARAFSLCTPSRFNLCGMIWGGEREAGGGGGGQQAGTVWGGLVSSAVVISTGGGGSASHLLLLLSLGPTLMVFLSLPFLLAAFLGLIP